MSKASPYERHTLSNFLQRAEAINGDKFDYSNIKEEDIKNARSIVKIFCKVEDHGVFEQGVSTP